MSNKEEQKERLTWKEKITFGSLALAATAFGAYFFIVQPISATIHNNKVKSEITQALNHRYNFIARDFVTGAFLADDTKIVDRKTGRADFYDEPGFQRAVNTVQEENRLHFRQSVYSLLGPEDYSYFDYYNANCLYLDESVYQRWRRDNPGVVDDLSQIAERFEDAVKE